jgi:RHS repeat-associated protein
MFLSSVSGRTIFDAGATGVTANWSQTYSYDRYGNKLGATPSGVDQNSASIVADGLRSVTASTSTNRITTSGRQYDLAGNLIRGKDGTAWQKFEYDAAGRLVKIKNDSNTVLETYTYGASRERLMVETSSQRRYFAWGGQNVVAEYVETGSGTTPDYSKSYIYAGSRLFMTATKASSTTETKEFHHPDRLGTQLVTEGSTGSSFRQSTMPFGTAISTETTGNTNQVFTSYDRSSTTGLDYAQNRTYSKGQSRFTQVDPIAMASASLGNPQSNNLFAYVQNMPTDFVDPSGLFTLTPRTITFAEFCIRSGLCQGTPTQSQPEETGGGGSPPPPDETCLLTVTQTPVGSAGSSSGSTGHLYITTTYQVPSEGISSTQGYRAGPQGGPMSGFGNINPQYGRYDTNFADYPKGSRDGYLDLFSQVFNGSCAKLDSSLQKTSDWILFSKVNYELLGPNSNSYVRTLLHYAGLEVGSMRISAVGWGTLIPLDPAQEPTLGYPRYR